MPASRASIRLPVDLPSEVRVDPGAKVEHPGSWMRSTPPRAGVLRARATAWQDSLSTASVASLLPVSLVGIIQRAPSLCWSRASRAYGSTIGAVPGCRKWK